MRRIVSIYLSLALLSTACGVATTWPFSFGENFSSNGERIFFTAVNEEGQRITYSGGPRSGGMMMGGQLSCVSCHGDDGRGGAHFMHMELMQAPNITYAGLSGEKDEHSESGEGHADDNGGYDLDDFRQAVIFGRHPNGKALDNDMPRWQLTEEDLVDLFEYIQTLP